MNMTPTEPPPHESTLTTQRLLIVLGPILAISALTVMLSLTASILGWHQAEMLAAGAGAGALLLVLTAVLLSRLAAERRAARQAQLNAEERIGGIVESAMDPIITIDANQNIVLFNKAAEEVFRWPRNAVVGQPLNMLLPERFRASHHRHVQHFGETGITTRRMGGKVDLVGITANGIEFPIEASISQHGEGADKLYTVILRDITARVQASQLLERSEARLRSILDSAMDAIITVDETQHIVLFNAAAEALFGCPRGEAIGAPLAWLLPVRFRDAHADHVRSFGETGTSSRRMGEQRLVYGLRRNGEEFPIEASISQISEQGHKFYTVILRDVTERVRAEAALRRSKEELQEMALATHSVREQEKTRIARELHDELGQALTALKMDVVWLRDRLADAPAPQKEKLLAMENLLNSTVAATRRISSELRPLMLDDLGLIPAAEWLVQNFAQRSGVDCKLVVGDPEPDLHDPYATAVFRIVQESLTNIAKHANAAHAEVGISSDGEQVTVTITDDGDGFRLDAPRRPNSYGLVGLRERAYLLGGEATIDSGPGLGTRITVRLPLAPTAADQ